MNLKEIRSKLASLTEELKDESITAERLTAIETEMRSLKAQEKACTEAAEKRQKLLGEIAAGAGESIENGQPQQRNNVLADDSPIAAPEYRNAYLKRLQGKELSAMEERAMTTVSGSVGNAIPTQTANMGNG